MPVPHQRGAALRGRRGVNARWELYAREKLLPVPGCGRPAACAFAALRHCRTSHLPGCVPYTAYPHAHQQRRCALCTMPAPPPACVPRSVYAMQGSALVYRAAVANGDSALPRSALPCLFKTSILWPCPELIKLCWFLPIFPSRRAD